MRLTTRIAFSRAIGLEFDHVLRQAGLASIHDLFNLGDDRLRRAVMHRKHADRLAAHPIAVETQDGFDCRPTIVAAALNEQQIARAVDAYGVGPDAETVEQFQHRLCGDKSQRHDADAETGLGGIAGRQSRRPSLRPPVSSDIRPVTDQRDVRHAQRALEHKQNVRLRNRPAGRKRDRALDARIDRVSGTRMSPRITLATVVTGAFSKFKS